MKLPVSPVVYGYSIYRFCVIDLKTAAYPTFFQSWRKSFCTVKERKRIYDSYQDSF